MARESYRRQLDELSDAVLSMGNLVASRLGKGLEALKRPEPELIEELFRGDDEVDRLYSKIERRCIDLLALQQPVAVDLRLITTAFKISTDIERVGDIAVNLGQYARNYHLNLRLLPHEQLFSIGDLVTTMVYESLKAFYDKDPRRAEEVLELDDQVDRMFWDLVSRLIEDLRGSPDRGEEIVTGAVALLLSIRDLERVADHAVNIAARTIYMIESRADYI
ncbi:MAG: phosphate signaling complex protein PhoU [Candidatus Acetothermia bacterium]|jgi:phosphate transport system protein|nr:phosphate signaling complex protein PhoU [Candidatus Acetothermia bacterium]MDH7505017.1 phosphate signaling complex protein PhoU [Candidatus Acetothermia bacterium]